MPFASRKQAAYLWMAKPDVAKEFASKTMVPLSSLPIRKKKKAQHGKK
jgi:hypothetical protein